MGMYSGPHNDPRYHVSMVRKMLLDLADHMEEDEEKLREPQAEALFETSREVLKALATTFEHYIEKGEKAWQQH